MLANSIYIKQVSTERDIFLDLARRFTKLFPETPSNNRFPSFKEEFFKVCLAAHKILYIELISFF